MADRESGKTDTRADGVVVGIAVTHDQHVVCLCHIQRELIGDDAGAHLGTLLDGLGASAVEFGIVRILDDDLVAAALERQIQRCVGIVILLGQ